MQISTGLTVLQLALHSVEVSEVTTEAVMQLYHVQNQALQALRRILHEKCGPAN